MIEYQRVFVIPHGTFRGCRANRFSNFGGAVLCLSVALLGSNHEILSSTKRRTLNPVCLTLGEIAATCHVMALQFATLARYAVPSSVLQARSRFTVGDAIQKCALLGRGWDPIIKNLARRGRELKVIPISACRIC